MKLTDEEITAQLNGVYAAEDSKLDPVLRELMLRALLKEDWQEAE